MVTTTEAKRTETTKAAAEVHEIFDGPSREKLFDSLRLAYDESAPIVEFAIKNGARLAGPVETSAWCTSRILFKVIGLEHEDGSGENFNFEGYIMPPPGRKVRVSYTEPVVGYFNTAKRQGTISLSTEVILEYEVR